MVNTRFTKQHEAIGFILLVKTAQTRALPHSVQEFPRSRTPGQANSSFSQNWLSVMFLDK